MDTDIICYIIGYIPVRPEIWSGQVLAALLGTCPIASQCRTLSSAARYGPCRCLLVPFLSQLREVGRTCPVLPAAAGRCGPRFRLQNRVVIRLLLPWKRRPRAGRALRRQDQVVSNAFVGRGDDRRRRRHRRQLSLASVASASIASATLGTIVGVDLATYFLQITLYFRILASLSWSRLRPAQSCKHMQTKQSQRVENNN